MRKIIFYILFLLLLINNGIAQTDSLVFKNGDIIVGELESMEKGVVTFSTDYSDSDFKIEWAEIKEIYTETYLLISITGGQKIYGWIRTSSDSLVNIISRDSIFISVKKADVVRIIPIMQGFKDRFSAEIDIGFSSAKANNLWQLSIGSKVGYKTDKWSGYISYNALASVQDSIDQIRREDAELVYQYIIHNDWYLVPSANYLSNTELSINYRINLLLGIARYIFRSNYAQWGLQIGVNRNWEDFIDETPGNKSWEGYLGTELDLFDTGDLKLFTKILAYPGITERGRWRFDGNLNIKYDLPLDFYIKLGLSFNYDNMPANESNNFDYVTSAGFGWEW